MSGLDDGRSVDVASIVPSTRDLFQVLATRRKRLAVVAIVDDANAAEEAARLDDVPVSAFAVCAAGLASEAASKATKSVPVLSLAEVSNREGALRARFHAADGVCLARGVDKESFDELATIVRTTRMLPIATVGSSADLELAISVSPRVALLRASTVDEALDWAAALPGLVLVAFIEGASLDVLRALAGHVDAVIVDSLLHRGPDFSAFVAAVDP